MLRVTILCSPGSSPRRQHPARTRDWVLCAWGAVRRRGAHLHSAPLQGCSGAAASADTKSGSDLPPPPEETAV